MAIQSLNGSLAALSMIRFDIQAYTFQRGSVAVFDAILTSSFGLECLITVITSRITASVRSSAVYIQLTLKTEEPSRAFEANE